MVVAAAKKAAAAVPDRSQELLCCCGGYLQLLSSGSTHSVLVPLLKLCGMCFSCMPHSSVGGKSSDAALLTDAAVQILHNAAHVVNSPGRESSKQGSAHLLDVMYCALPLAHSPEAHLEHVAPDGRGAIVQSIDDAMRTLCMQPYFLHHAVHELLSASSQQGLQQFACEHGDACPADISMAAAAEEEEVQPPHGYLDNVLFAPWEWLERAAKADTLHEWQQAMVACLPAHAYWLIGLCSTTRSGIERQDGSSRSKGTRGVPGVAPSTEPLWSACVAVLHRSMLAVQDILRCGGSPGNKRSKPSKKQAKQSLGASTALLTALQVCSMAIKACADYQVLPL